MQDPTKTVASALETEWTQWGSLQKADINFVRGDPVDIRQRFASKQVSIEVKKLTDPIIKKSLSRSTHKEVIEIDVWLDLVDISETRKDDLMDEMQKIKDEIERIIKLKQTTLTDIRFAFPRSWQNLDRLRPEEPPYLRSAFYLVCLYEK